MRISAEAEVHRAVVAEDGAVDRHLASHRNIGIAVQHLAAEQIERELWSGHIRANHVEGSDRQLARNWSGQSLHRSWEHSDQTSGQADQLGGVHALQKFRSLVNGREQLSRRSNGEWNRDWNERDSVA